MIGVIVGIILVVGVAYVMYAYYWNKKDVLEDVDCDKTSTSDETTTTTSSSSTSTEPPNESIADNNSIVKLPDGGVVTELSIEMNGVPMVTSESGFFDGLTGNIILVGSHIPKGSYVSAMGIVNTPPNTSIVIPQNPEDVFSFVSEWSVNGIPIVSANDIVSIPPYKSRIMMEYPVGTEWDANITPLITIKDVPTIEFANSLMQRKMFHWVKRYEYIPDMETLLLDDVSNVEITSGNSKHIIRKVMVFL